MARFWIIAPYAANPVENFESGWDFDLANNTISIGWPGLGNVLNMTEAELNEELPRQAAADQATHSEHAVVLYRVIRPGDMVIARSGRKVRRPWADITGYCAWGCFRVFCLPVPKPSGRTRRHAMGGPEQP